jgi:5-methylcytosine-specific restriction endonuclease McrA
MGRKISFEEFKNLFESNDCKLLESEFKSAKSPVNYICSCGNKAVTTYDNFRSGKRCAECGNRKRSESSSLTIADVYEDFEIEGYTVTGTFKKGKRQYFNYICPRGHESNIVFYSFKSGNRCKQCANEDASERYRLSIDSVRKEFEEQGCELLSKEYTNMEIPLDYKCSCGNISKAYLKAIRLGIKCGCQRPRGEESPHWNPDKTQEERELGRKIPGYREWITEVYERDRYTCQKCGEVGGKLNAHHIEGYAENKDLRTDLENGITLCKNCHKNFHSTYGTKGFGREELNEFLKR